MNKKLIILFLLALHILLLVNLRFTAWPEMLSFAYLKNSGFLMYKDMLHMYPPLLTLLLAYTYLFFGHSLVVLKGISWLVILATGILVYLVSKQAFKKEEIALLSLASYVFVQPFVVGNMIWFEFLVAPLVLLGLLLFLRYLDNKRLIEIFGAGFFLALASTTKQVAGVFLALVGIYLLLKKFSWKSLVSLVGGALIVFGVLFARVYQEGQIQDFWYWVFTYPSRYWVNYPGNVQIPTFQDLAKILFLNTPLLIVLHKKFKDFKKPKFILLVLFYLVSLLMIYPRFSFFRLQTTFSLLSILSGFAIYQLREKRLAATYFFFALALFVAPTISSDWRKETRFIEDDNLKIAKIVSNTALKEEKVYLQGIHSGIYTLADRVPPKPWVDNHSWYFDAPVVEEWLLEGWEKDPPIYIFAKEKNKSELINTWISENYTIEDVAEEDITIWKRN